MAWSQTGEKPLSGSTMALFTDANVHILASIKSSATYWCNLENDVGIIATLTGITENMAWINNQWLSLGYSSVPEFRQHMPWNRPRLDLDLIHTLGRCLINVGPRVFDMIEPIHIGIYIYIYIYVYMLAVGAMFLAVIYAYEYNRMI